ncbi:hypothetical protein PHMEG_0002144 [Phytophthora megakarya]|uniref:Uncharacterized protein n=1 Tax=Phytophthora megakarya TaxID=4795 RepID=A0A225WZD6_9STRA|nr:hypothetical protein PHMEG_0002144 [Phytophthora megakarya]
MDESPYRPRITLTDALSDLVTALNETSVGPQRSQSGSYDHGYETNEDSFNDGECWDDERIDTPMVAQKEDERGHVAAANDHERRVTAEGTFAWSDNRRTKGDGNFSNDRSHTRDNLNGRQQHGPCAVGANCVSKSTMLESVKLSTSSLVSSGRQNDLTPVLQNMV